MALQSITGMPSDTKVIDLEDVLLFCGEHDCAWRSVGDLPKLLFMTYSRERQSSYTVDELLKRIKNLKDPLITLVRPQYVLDSTYETNMGGRWFSDMRWIAENYYGNLGATYIWIGVSKKEEKMIVKEITGKKWTTNRLLDFELKQKRNGDVGTMTAFCQCMDRIHQLAFEKLYQAIERYEPIATRPLFSINTHHPFENSWLKEKLAEKKFEYVVVDIAHKKIQA